MTVSNLILASTSPRRRDILRSIGLNPQVDAVTVDESRYRDECPEVYVLRIARAKASAWVETHRDAIGTGARVLAADTAVVLGGRIYGKPVDRADAIEMLQSLGGRTHQVYTGVVLVHHESFRETVSCTDVTLRGVAAPEAEQYWASGEPAGKAGGYAVQGIGGMFVSRINGSYSGVVGLPVFETVELLAASGFAVLPRASYDA